MGVAFSRAVDGAVSAVARFPGAFPEVHGSVRKAILRRFPYSLLFILEGDDVVVLGCFHHRQDPKNWAERPY